MLTNLMERETKERKVRKEKDGLSLGLIKHSFHLFRHYPKISIDSWSNAAD